MTGRLVPDRLYHFTCDHGHLGIGDKGLLVPGSMQLALRHEERPIPWTAALVWCTDLERPGRDSVGLTSYALTCDRMAHRYRVDPTLCEPWTDVRRRVLRLFPDDVDGIEGAPGARPMHWWVAFVPVPADYDPLVTA